MSSKNCKARQHSDQMVCPCGLAWDMNDPDPPECRQGVVAKQELAAMRVVLQEPSRFASIQRRLLTLQEMPLRWLPTANVAAGLYTVRWDSLPKAVFVLVDDFTIGKVPGKSYKFFNERGRLDVEVERVEGLVCPFRYRHGDGGWIND